MINLQPPPTELILPHSPMTRGYMAAAEYMTKHGEIGLTKTGAWNRRFVEWAVAEIAFPGWTEEKLYSVNKVLNEYDVAPLEYLHALMDGLKWGRKYKGTYRLTKTGKALAASPDAAFAQVVPAFLFRFDHAEGMRSDAPIGNWDIFLNILNHEIGDGITADRFARFLYGDVAPGWGGTASGLSVAVLRPLCWTGLLMSEGGFGLEERVFRKSPLWDAVAHPQILTIGEFCLGTKRIDLLGKHGPARRSRDRLERHRKTVSPVERRRDFTAPRTIPHPLGPERFGIRNELSIIHQRKTYVCKCRLRFCLRHPDVETQHIGDRARRKSCDRDDVIHLKGDGWCDFFRKRRSGTCNQK